MAYLTIVPVAYLLGSIPWGLVLVRLVRGLDVRRFGSGNIGATNVLRTGGAFLGLLALVLDGGKAALAVLVARLVADSLLAEVVAGVLVVVGHNWPVFLKFRGGRGMAPATGAAAVMVPLALAAGAAVFVPTVLLTRYVSLATLAAVGAGVGTLAVAVGVQYYPVSYLVYGILAGAIVALRHRDNVRRLLDGTEHRIGQPFRHL